MPGHGQSGRFFYHKTTRLVEALHEIALDRDAKRCSERIELFYVNGPLSAGQGPESDVWTWGQGDFEAERRIWGLDASINKIMDILAKHGPFDGIIGFSTGATIAAIITSLLEGNRKARLDIKQVCRNKTLPLGDTSNSENMQTRHPPFRFAVCFSGFMLQHPDYRAFYHPKIRTPVMHYIAEYDTMIPEALTRQLATACAQREVQKFKGTHYVPRQREEVVNISNFILRHLDWPEDDTGYSTCSSNGR